MRELVIDGVRIADDEPAYVIAEIGHNHKGDLNVCKEMFDAAKWAGCSAVKLQKRDNKSLYTEEFYNSPYNSENAFGKTYGEHREALEFGWDEYETLRAHAKKIDLTFFATAFDPVSADFLHKLDMPAIKLASGDLTNCSLLEHVARTWVGKPVIYSTGGGTEMDIKRAHSILTAPYALTTSERHKVAILQCTSGYPAAYDELDLRVIQTFANWFHNTVIGWSGHDTGIFAALAAYALGARIIEKHFTLNRAWKGTDQAFSLEAKGMKAMVDDLRQIRAALGDGVKRRYASEIEPLKKQIKNAEGKIDGRSIIS